MNRGRELTFLSLISVFATVIFLASESWASEGSGGWRSTYDLVMKWVNFFILVFVIVKYTRRPLKNFLTDRKADLEQEIQKLEAEKEEVAQQAGQAMKTLEESAETLSSLRTRIITEGEKERERLIQEGRSQAQMMLESARQKIENQLRHARRSVVEEMVDSSVALALRKLPDKLTPEDHQRWIDRFTSMEPAK